MTCFICTFSFLCSILCQKADLVCQLQLFHFGSRLLDWFIGWQAICLILRKTGMWICFIRQPMKQKWFWSSWLVIYIPANVLLKPVIPFTKQLFCYLVQSLDHCQSSSFNTSVIVRCSSWSVCQFISCSTEPIKHHWMLCGYNDFRGWPIPAAPPSLIK